MQLKFYRFSLHPLNDLSNRYNTIFSNELKTNLEKFGNTVTFKDIIQQDAFIKLSDIPFYENSEYPDLKMLCDDFFIIENTDNGKFIVIDIQDSLSLMRYMLPHENCVGFIQTFYNQKCITQEFKKSHLVTVGNYFPIEPDLVESYYDTISKITPTDKRLFFSGTIGYENGYVKSDGSPRREVVMIMKEKHPDEVRVLDRNNKLPRIEWWKEAAKHYINLALPGHPWCSREHELWALGLPILSTYWVSPTIFCPRPNYHYLSTDGGDVEWTGVCEDPEYAADKLYERYKKSIDNPEYLKWIGSNGRKYYLDYIKPSSSAKYYAETINNWVLLKN